MSGTSGGPDRFDRSTRDLLEGSRGQSEVIGVVLLLGLVMAGIGALTLVGPELLDTIDEQNRIEAAEQTMREVDAQIIHMKGTGENTSTTVLASPGKNGRVYLEDDRSMNHYSVSITTTNGSSCEIPDQQLGQLTYEHTKSGAIVAYQAGGVWKRTSDGGSLMVSPPDLRYRGPKEKGTLSVAMANVSGNVRGYGRIELTSDLNETRERNRKLQRRLSPCWGDLESVTVTVKSNDFADAWERYMETEFPGKVTRIGTAEVSVSINSSSLSDYTEPKPTNATIEVLADDDTVGKNGNNVTIESSGADARVTLLGTELSGISEDGCDTGYYRYRREKYEICDVNHGGVTMEVLTDDGRYTPWPDDDPIDAPYNGRDIYPSYNTRIEQEDVNDPQEMDEIRNESFSYNLTNLSRGDTVTVFAQSWRCRDSEGRIVTDEGTNQEGRDLYFRHYGCAIGEKRIDIDSNQNTGNLYLLRDGEEVPNFKQAGREQRSSAEILGQRVNNTTGRLQLNPGEVVFLYELSEPNADPDQADQSGDPDYNDAIVLFRTIAEDKTVRVQDPDTSPPVTISGNKVVVG